MKTCCLIEVPHEHVFVISHRDNRLKNKYSGSDNGNCSRPAVGMLPSDAVVNFVQTNGIWLLDWLPLGIADDE